MARDRIRGRGVNRGPLSDGTRRVGVLVRLSPEERNELADRAAAAKVSVARYLTESALAPALSAPERRARQRELLEVGYLIGQLSADVNELARVAGFTGRPPEGTAEALAKVARLADAVERIARASGYEEPTPS